MNAVIKTPQDIEKMRIAGRLASEVLDFITPYVKAGVTTGASGAATIAEGEGGAGCVGGATACVKAGAAARVSVGGLGGAKLSAGDSGGDGCGGGCCGATAAPDCPA